MTDALDAIMAVMEDAFDSQYGEAWTRRQVADSLTLRNVFFTLINADGTTDGEPEKVSGFALTRQVLDEEEILLIAVRPSCRGNGVGKQLLAEVIDRARARNAARIFLEMRDGNPAEHLYRRFGFEKIGHRRGYYRGAVGGPLDAITFAKDI
ncbi:ribosomal protein S18-alanine N-acetyltransferase [Aurantiacibacter zhengii]|uniref:[Ribosomal protein bS18]-alanine N-acetyltransferase n=1 Tax=Aurantiacibacter zhengii TaxID=2307003 RepID=A0A418NXE0_9SPHN|nr:ribosomal protein S18-alanine N-acetyltransferase [Aurantiacibacter zhengii]RIV89266.1 ribosomal-protein-alanine N-acetyltransferase [Aurantiacibacter zhengii]